MSIREAIELYAWMWRRTAGSSWLPVRVAKFGWTVGRDLSWATWAAATRLGQGGGLGIARLAITGTSRSVGPVGAVAGFLLICTLVVAPVLTLYSTGATPHAALTVTAEGHVEFGGQKMRVVDLGPVLDHFSVRSVDVTIAGLTPYLIVQELQEMLAGRRVRVVHFDVGEEPRRTRR